MILADRIDLARNKALLFRTRLQEELKRRKEIEAQKMSRPSAGAREPPKKRPRRDRHEESRSDDYSDGSSSSGSSGSYSSDRDYDSEDDSYGDRRNR